MTHKLNTLPKSDFPNSHLKIQDVYNSPSRTSIEIKDFIAYRQVKGIFPTYYQIMFTQYQVLYGYVSSLQTKRYTQ